MRSRFARATALSVVTSLFLVMAVTASEAAPVHDATSTFDFTANMEPVGYSARTVPASGAGSGRFNSDLGFWENKVYHGHYDGFRIVDVADPANPVELVNYTQCVGDQGDVLVWEHLLIRSWNTPASAASMCGGLPVGMGFEGLHIFDVSDPASPALVGSVRMATGSLPTSGCGSHTATLVPDVARGNIYVYNSASSSSCPGIDIVRIPLANPSMATFVRREPSGRSCHDTGVILGDVNLLSCAGGNGFTVWSMDPSLDTSQVGSVEDPVELYSKTVPGVSIGHSASFSWDGQVLIYGHEPGGGSQAQCQATSSTTNRTIYFFDADTGTQLGSMLHPRPQASSENCTWHNYNIVPTNRGYVMVSGNYQSGVSVVDFTDPANAREIAYADPAPLAPTALGGDWSTYWYDGLIYESDITRGLIIWRLTDPLVEGVRTFGHLNPQTQETSFALDSTPPTTTASLDPAPTNGWYRDPTVTLTAEDDAEGSGVVATEYALDGGAFSTYTGPFQVTGDGDHVLEYRSTDGAGNAEPTQTLEFKIDATSPTISIATPADGATYLLGQEVLADYTCADALSGVEACDGTAANGSAIDTGTVGTHTFGVEAQDAAGNQATSSVDYSVVYAFSGFFRPVDPAPVQNVTQPGSSVPLKFSLGGDQGLDILAAGYPMSRQIGCDSGAPEDVLEETASAGQSGLSYEDDQYTYVLNTSKAWAGTCREVIVRLADGTEHGALFRFKG